MKTELNTIKLKGLSTDELKEILIDSGNHVSDNLSNKSNSELITLIEHEAKADAALQKRLSKLQFSFKPSFYLTYIEDKSTYNKRRVTKTKIEAQLALINADKNTEKYPPITGYQLFDIKKSDDLIELHFLWQKIHWYWSPKFQLSHIYELNYGLALIDLKTNKAILSCHTKQERDDIAKVINNSIGVKLNPLSLTKGLLDQIGSFDTVKRARYFVGSSELPLPQNITLGDKNLSTKQLAQEQENNSDISRKESFYKIQLNEVEEQGVGVTSESGKLWIPQKITVTQVKDYGLGLLARVSDELNVMTQNEDYEKIFNSLGIQASPVIMAVGSVNLRKELYRLFFAVSNMLIKGESERAFTPNNELLSIGIPLYFNPFKILLTGETGDYFYGDEYSNIFKLKKDGSEYKLVDVIGSKDVADVIEKDTGEVYSIQNAIERVLLTPTPKLEQIFLDLLKSVATQFPTLHSLIGLPFRIESNMIYINIDRAFGRTGANFAVEINPKEINQLKQILGKSYSYDLPAKTLHLMGEKCEDMTDANCKKCTSENKYACLRTIVAKTMDNSLLLAHKGIELSDLQGVYNINSDKLKIFVFAKLGEGSGGLTARNKNGAVLLGQVLNQIDKSEFNTVCILTSSTINEDLLSRLRLVCSTFSKKLLIINSHELEDIFGYWYEDIESQGLDPKEILKNSGKKLKTAINKHDR